MQHVRLSPSVTMWKPSEPDSFSSLPECCPPKDGARRSSAASARGLAVARQHLGSLDKITRLVRLRVMIASNGGVQGQPRVADGASKLLQDIFGADRNPCRTVFGVTNLPLGVPVELELIFEVTP